MTAESGRRASRLELIRARLHESTSGRRCAGRGDGAASAPATAVPRPSPSTATQNGVRPAPGSRADGKPVQPGKTSHDRAVSAGRQTQVKGQSKLDAGVDGQLYAQVRRKPTAPADRGPTDADDCRPSPDHDESSTVSARKRPTAKTSSSSSLLSRSQNFFARLRAGRCKNDAAGSCADGGGSGSKRKIRRSVSDSGCAMYANRELVASRCVDASPPSSAAHLVPVTSSDDVTDDVTVEVATERRTVVDRPETDGRRDVVATTSVVYAEVEPATSRTSTTADVTRPAESTSVTTEQADNSCPQPTVGSGGVYEECAGSYSLREALLRRGPDAVDTSTSTTTSSHAVIRRDDDPARRAHATSLLPVAGRSAGWRRRRLAGSQSAGCVVAARLERIQEVDSPPGSAEDDDRALRLPRACNAERRPGFDTTSPGSDARHRKFPHHVQAGPVQA